MQSYNFSEAQRIFGRTITKGTQEKYFLDDYYYKVDTIFDEGATEYLVTLLLQHTALNPKSYVTYEPCIINNQPGCKSKSFLLNPDESFVTMNSLYEKQTGNTDLANHLMSLSTAETRLNYLLELVSTFNIDVSQFRQYLNTLMQLDMLILNPDRHVHNYGVIYNEKLHIYRVAPIFDNGQALSVEPNIRPVACTLSGSFEDQVVAFGYPIQPCFYINYVTLDKALAKFKNEFPHSKKLIILKDNLVKYKSLFNLATNATSVFSNQ